MYIRSIVRGVFIVSYNLIFQTTWRQENAYYISNINDMYEEGEGRVLYITYNGDIIIS